MESDSESILYAGVGPVAAVLLGMALIPLRGVTTASNLTFAFLALIIVIAELGGRWAAVATAISSALSLNFFLTQPYLRLTIHSKDDIVAFCGLAVCGLIAASFGSRGKRVRALSEARRELDLLDAASREIELSGPIEARVTRALDAAREALALSAAVVRDNHGTVLAVSARAHGPRPVPQRTLELDARVPLPEDGPGLRSSWRTRPLAPGYPGNGARASASTRRAIGDVARLISVMVAEASGGEALEGKAR
jgi:K+-sensing histidine kinase KdpD